MHFNVFRGVLGEWKSICDGNWGGPHEVSIVTTFGVAPQGGAVTIFKRQTLQKVTIVKNLLGVLLARFSGPGPPKNGGGFLCRVRFLSQMRDAVVGTTAESTKTKMTRVLCCFSTKIQR